MKPAIIWKVRPTLLFVCPICRWRVSESVNGSAKIMFKEHMKREHQIAFNQVKLLKGKS